MCPVIKEVPMSSDKSLRQQSCSFEQQALLSDLGTDKHNSLFTVVLITSAKYSPPCGKN